MRGAVALLEAITAAALGLVCMGAATLACAVVVLVALPLLLGVLAAGAVANRLAACGVGLLRFAARRRVSHG